MLINFREDFIYYVSDNEATLILHNCDQKCRFCPAAHLKCFQNYSELNAIFDFKCKKLTVYGNVRSNYIETFLKKLKLENPDTQIELIACDCVLSQFIELDYYHIIYPELTEYFKLMPKGFILPATGDLSIMVPFAIRHRMRYPEIPIIPKVFDTSTLEMEFWAEETMEDFRKKMEMNESRI